MAHSEGFEPYLSIRSASFSAHIAIIAVRDSVVNRVDIAIVCTFVCTLVLLMKNRGLLYRGAGELLSLVIVTVSGEIHCRWFAFLVAI
jgi:hypothetical protein